MYSQVQAAKATQFHRVIAYLAKREQLQRLYSQNIDGIDTQFKELKTEIPLPEQKPWPMTIQLHGGLRTLKCEENHIQPFDPTLFDSTKYDSPYCRFCEEAPPDKYGISTVHRTIPRVWLYNDPYHPDRDAIDKVITADVKAKPKVVVVVGTALQVPTTKIFVRDMCRATRAAGGFTVWINLKPPPKGLDFNMAIIGDCQKVAWHVSSWFLEECPSFLYRAQIQNLQNKCGLFITRTPEEALSRSLKEANVDFVAKILQEHENKSQAFNVENGKTPVLAQSSQRSGTRQPVNQIESLDHSLPTKTSALSESSDPLPELPECWLVEMSERLKKVAPGTETGDPSLSAVTPINNLGYRDYDLTKYLWHLKPGEWLNDVIINAYFELLRKAGLSAGHAILGSFVLHSGWGILHKKKLISKVPYFLYVPVNMKKFHWSFAVIKKDKDDGPVYWTYYDSRGEAAPQHLLSWIEGFPGPKAKPEAKDWCPASSNPEQTNGSDCGLFVLLGIRLLSSRGHNLTQAESERVIPTFRQRLLAELLSGSLNPSSSQFKEFKRKELQASSDQSELLMVETPPPSGKVSAIQSPNELEEPKELLQAESSKKTSREKKSPTELASAFAEEKSIVDNLRDAVVTERNSRHRVESIPFSALWHIIETEKRSLKQRYLHYEFSRRFWQAMMQFERNPREQGRMKKDIIRKVQSDLQIEQADWTHVLTRARKASVWTDLAEIFKGDVEHPSVVLCAVSGGTSVLEKMTLADREIFFEKIRSRKMDPGDRMLANLKAVDTLYWAVICNNLPESLLIMLADKSVPFEDVVRCKSRSAVVLSSID
jgi:NAD-dependent histone deacetylase SIR2